MEGYQLLLHQPNILQLPQGLCHGAGSAVDDLRDGLVVERQIPPPTLVGLNHIRIERHIQHDRVDLLEILGDDSEVERIYKIIEKQEEY